MTVHDVRAIRNDRVENEIDILHSIIENWSKLGFRSFCFDNNIAGVHPRTLYKLKMEGFNVIREHKVVVPDEIEEYIVTIDWH